MYVFAEAWDLPGTQCAACILAALKHELPLLCHRLIC